MRNIKLWNSEELYFMRDKVIQNGSTNNITHSAASKQNQYDFTVTGRFAHGQFARGRFARGQFVQNGIPKVRLG